MKRDLYKKLLEWKSSARRKPLLLKGARQVGKTFLLQEFGEREYSYAADSQSYAGKNGENASGRLLWQQHIQSLRTRCRFAWRIGQSSSRHTYPRWSAFQRIRGRLCWKLRGAAIEITYGIRAPLLEKWQFSRDRFHLWNWQRHPAIRSKSRHQSSQQKSADLWEQISSICFMQDQFIKLETWWQDM